jgi:hypothetical protein
MWMLENHTPYEAERSWVQDKDGVQHWIVVVKATYDIRPNGSVALAEAQVPILRLAEHNGDPASSSLVHEADIVGRKVATDVLVNGTAYAPGGKRVRSTEVAIRVAGVNKTLLVTGDRRWSSSGIGVAPTGPEPFDMMPVTYERAFGGFDRADEDVTQHRMYDTNPAGTGFATREKHLIDHALPNVEYPDQRVRSWKDRPTPAGLGPIPCWWSPRREYSGTYDQRWMAERAPLWAIDFDDRYHQSAPPDQQVGAFLRGGETVELSNLTPSGLLRFALPQVHLGFTSFFGREQQHHVGHLDAVIVEPDHNRLMLVWQSLLNCHHQVDYLDKTRILQKSDVTPPRPASVALIPERS